METPPFISWDQSQPGMTPPAAAAPPAGNPPQHPVHPLLQALIKGAHLIGQTVENAQNPQEVVQRQNEARQRQQGQTDQWNQVQQGLAQGIINNPQATPEQKKSALQRIASVFGGAQNADQASQLLQGYASPAEEQERQIQLRGQQAIDLQKTKAANPTTAGRIAVLGSQSPQDAIKIMNMTGQTYQDLQGNEITEDMLREAPPYMKLETIRQGSNTYQLLVDQRSRTAAIGNEIYQIPEIGEITPTTSMGLGVKSPPTESTHQVPGMNPGEKINLTSTRTPSVPGMTAPSATPTAPGTEPVLQARPVSSKTPQPPGVPVAQANTEAINGKLNAKKPQSKQIPGPSGIPPQPPAFASGTMLTQGRNAEPVVASMNTVAAQVFGGNGEPPIWDNAWMFDKPELRTALNKALTLNALAIPGTEDDPTFTQTLATALGVTGWSQEQIQKANIKAREDLQKLGGDQAVQMFARMAGMQEDLSALRSATKGSAAQGSIRTLVRAAPIYNVASSKNFRDQLGVTLNTAAAAMSGYPAISKQYLDWWKNGAQAARNTPTKSPSNSGSHEYAIDANGKRRKVLDPKAKLPEGWKWAE